MKNLLKNKRRALLSGVLIVLLLAVAGTTLAILLDDTAPVNNTFTPTEVTCAVDEDFTDKDVKKNVRIQNTGYADAYIRVAVVYNWVKADNGKIVSAVAVDPARDLEIVMGSSNWFLHEDGYYYYKQIVPDGTEKYTEYLFESIQLAEGVAAPAGYTLSVEIIADAVQAEGIGNSNVKPVIDAWGIDPGTVKEANNEEI